MEARLHPDVPSIARVSRQPRNTTLGQAASNVHMCARVANKIDHATHITGPTRANDTDGRGWTPDRRNVNNNRKPSSNAQWC
eukprot:5814333-Alexandrium_andersonii.AAC.1